MINAVIIDDEQHNIDNLKSLLHQHCKEVEISETAIDSESAKESILRNKPDLVFLDIQMPGKNGFELLQSLPDYSFEVIFVTAFDNYGIQAVKFAAIDYLLKPINIEELKIAVKKVVEKKQKRNQNLQLENLIRLLKNNQQEHRIALPSAQEIKYVNPTDIIRCESSNNYTTFYFAAGEKLVVSRPIYFYEELLQDYNFIRCHQSHLVNKKYILSLVKEDGGYLLLKDKTQLPISKQKKEIIKTLFQKSSLW